MTQSAQVVHDLWQQSLTDIRKRPVRVTLLDPDSRERVSRGIGIVSQADPEGLRVEVVEWTGEWQDSGPATVEVLFAEQIVLFATQLKERSDSYWVLSAPNGFQEAQRRRYPRLDLEVPVHVILSEGNCIPGVLRDISAGGAAVKTSSPLSFGQSVTLAFDLGSGLYFQPVAAEVVRCSPWRASEHVSGLRFIISEAHHEVLARTIAQLKVEMESQAVRFERERR